MATLPSPADIERIVGLMCKSIEFSNRQQWGDAVACLDAGLRIDPRFVPCRLARAKALAAMARFDEALADLNHVLRRVQLPDASASFAAVFAAAMAHVDARLAADPADKAAYAQRGNVHWQANDPAAALEDYERALGLDAGDVALHMARGNALYKLGRFADAIAAYEHILELDRENALAWFNLGNALQKNGRLDQAIDGYRNAAALAPDFAEARLEQAHCLLAQGKFAEGWRMYESRWQTAQMKHAQLPSEQPRWLGETGLEGKTILLWAEQGFGDTIQFARFIPRVADIAGKVVVRLPEALSALLAPLDARVIVVREGEALPPHDAHCPLMSLPLALGVADDVAPAGASYLRADAALGQGWQARLGAKRGPRIGVCWAGRRAGASGAYNPGRDISLETLMPLAAWDAEFICLQKELTEADDAMLATLPTFVPVRQGLDNFADTAALIDNLDLVITVDTAIAHLAGALGKPCWLLLRRAGEWRWQRERADSPWYPSMRLFRQQVEGDWDEVVRRVVLALQAS